MKSLERQFKKVTRNHKDWSSLVCFAYSVFEKDYNQQAISRWFNILVDKSDYNKKDKKGILAFIKSVSKELRTTKNMGKLPLGE